jgi:hypothetical protein
MMSGSGGLGGLYDLDKWMVGEMFHCHLPLATQTTF